MPRIRRAFRIGLHLVAPTVSPPLEEAALQEALALEGVPIARVRQKPSRPIRPIARLRTNDLWV